MRWRRVRRGPAAPRTGAWASSRSRCCRCSRGAALSACTDAVDYAVDGLDKFNTEKEVAQYLRKAFVDKVGRGLTRSLHIASAGQWPLLGARPVVRVAEPRPRGAYAARRVDLLGRGLRSGGHGSSDLRRFHELMAPG